MTTLDALTPRETEVLTLVAQGCASAEIARRLGVQYATVKNHLTRAYARLGVQSRTQAVVVACQRGLITLPEVTK